MKTWFDRTIQNFKLLSWKIYKSGDTTFLLSTNDMLITHDETMMHMQQIFALMLHGWTLAVFLVRPVLYIKGRE